jgi:hypothetical protein
MIKFSSFNYVALLHSTLQMFLRLRAGGGAPWRLQGDGGHHGWGVFVVLSRQKMQNVLIPT